MGIWSSVTFLEDRKLLGDNLTVAGEGLRTDVEARMGDDRFVVRRFVVP